MEVIKELSSGTFGKIILSGAVVNFFLVIIGSILGAVFKKSIPERLQKALMQGMAFCVLYIGITGLFEDLANILVIIVCVAIGAVLGELIDLDALINKLGKKLESAVNKSGSVSSVSEGFVAATLLFCVGAMTVVGSIDSGISGDNSTLYSKSVIDCISAAVLTSSMGIGVIFSAFSVLIIQGSITLLAGVIAPFITDFALAQMSVIGSLLIIALALNMLNITKIKVMNYLPAVLLPLVLCIF